MRSQAGGKRRGARTWCWGLEAELGQCGSGQVEEVHRLRDVDEGVRVVLQTELLSLVVKVGLDQEVGAECGGARSVWTLSFRLRELTHLAPESQVPFRA